MLHVTRCWPRQDVEQVEVCPSGCPTSHEAHRSMRRLETTTQDVRAATCSQVRCGGALQARMHARCVAFCVGQLLLRRRAKGPTTGNTTTCSASACVGWNACVDAHPASSPQGRALRTLHHGWRWTGTHPVATDEPLQKRPPRKKKRSDGLVHDVEWIRCFTAR